MPCLRIWGMSIFILIYQDKKYSSTKFGISKIDRMMRLNNQRFRTVKNIYKIKFLLELDHMNLNLKMDMDMDVDGMVMILKNIKYIVAK